MRRGWVAAVISTLPLCGLYVFGAQMPPPLVIGGTGAVLVDGHLNSPRFLKLDAGQSLQTTNGRVWVLPRFSVTVLMDQQTSLKIIDSARCKLESGSILVHVLKHRDFKVYYKDAVVELGRKGWYSLDASAGTLRVYSGEASVAAGGAVVRLGTDHQIELSATLHAAMFGSRDKDALYRWATTPRPDGILARVPCTGQVLGGQGDAPHRPPSEEYCADDLPPFAP